MQQSASAATALITTKPLNGSKTANREPKRNETKEEEEIWRERHRPSFAVV